MENTKRLELFETAPVSRAVLTMAIPTIISSLVTVLYNLADTYFVGMLNNPVENAAVTLAAPVPLAFCAVTNLFGVGTSSMMSRAMGRHDYDDVRRCSAFGFYASLVCSIMFSLLCSTFASPLMKLLGTGSETWESTYAYLHWTVFLGAAPSIINVVMAYLVRSVGATLHASIGTMAGCLLNIILDPIFILPRGLNMGAAGAGLATFLSNCFACLYFMVLLFVKRRSTYVSVNPRHLKKVSRYIIFGICAVGIPACIQNLLNVTGSTVLNNFTSAYGSDAVAAMGISHKISMIPMYISMGLSQGVMPLISYNYASGNVPRMKNALLFATRLSLSFLTAMSVLYYIFAGNLIGMFMKNDVIIAYGARFLRGMCFATPLLAMDFLGVNTFNACGMGRKALVFALLRKVVLEIPALFILNALFPLYGLAYSQLCAEIVLAALAVVSLVRLFRRLEAGYKIK